MFGPRINVEPEELYLEKEETFPNQIIYDLENNEVTIPTSEDEIISQPKSDIENVNDIQDRDD